MPPKKTAVPPKTPPPQKGDIYVCVVCGYEYDESKEGKKFSELPDDWVCPVCGAGKDQFEKK
jgi:rubredoxin